MPQSYANIQDAVEQLLQDTGNAVYDPTELGIATEASLQEFAGSIPHIVPVVFQIESRKGTATSDTSLTDTTKSQFVAGDAAYEKVVHNIRDNTWAVILANSSESVNTLSADIMDSGDSYEIYNKRCWNKRQIYIGDVTDYLWIDSVEYPAGTKRNWDIYDDVLEVVVDEVRDSNSTLDPLTNIDVLVRFAKPQRLCQLTDLSGQTHTEATAGATTIQVKLFKDDEVIEDGDEFHIEDHRTTYTVTAGVTLDLQTSTGKPISFFPGLEATATATEHDSGIAFTKSTLQPQHEQLLIRLIAARAVLSHSTSLMNTVSVGGAGSWRDFYQWAKTELEDVLAELRGFAKPRTTMSYTRGR